MFLPAISSEASAKSRGLSLAMQYCASSIQSKMQEITGIRSASVASKMQLPAAILATSWAKGDGTSWLMSMTRRLGLQSF